VIDIDAKTIFEQVGQQIAVSDWLEITQTRIDQFAEATGDHQWIHVDPVRAAAETPFKSTIAHGFLTLSLLSTLIRESIQFTGLRMAINCGLNRVRFVSPVLAGSKIRALITPQFVSRVTDGGIQVTWQVTIEREGGDKPACVAEWIVRYYPQG
jgi:acyl dehydratase